MNAPFMVCHLSAIRPVQIVSHQRPRFSVSCSAPRRRGRPRGLARRRRARVVRARRRRADERRGRAERRINKIRSVGDDDDDDVQGGDTLARSWWSSGESVEGVERAGRAPGAAARTERGRGEAPSSAGRGARRRQLGARARPASRVAGLAGDSLARARRRSHGRRTHEAAGGAESQRRRRTRRRRAGAALRRPRTARLRRRREARVGH